MARSAKALLDRKLYRWPVTNFKGKTLKEVASNLHKSWYGKCGSSEADILNKLQIAQSKGLIVPRLRRGTHKGYRTLLPRERQMRESRLSQSTPKEKKMTPAEVRRQGWRVRRTQKAQSHREHVPLRDLAVELVLTPKDRRRKPVPWHPAAD